MRLIGIQYGADEYSTRVFSEFVDASIWIDSLDLDTVDIKNTSSHLLGNK